MKSGLLVRVLAVFSVTGILFGASNSVTAVSGPQLGLIFDPAAGGLRPVRGIPGAASTGDTIGLGFRISSAAISPSQDAALVVNAKSGAVSLIRAAGDEWSVNALAGAAPAPDRITFSASGSVAALYYRTGSVQVFAGLPAAPVRASEIDVSAISGRVSAMAVDDAATYLLLGASQAGLALLYRVTSNSTPVALGSFQSVSALRIFDASQRALVIDGAASTLYQIADPADAAVATVIAAPRDGLQSLVGADTDASGQRIFAAAGNGQIYILTGSGGAPAIIDCGCAPTGLYRLAGPAVFRLTEIEGGPFQVLDATLAPRILAVPPPADAVAPQEARR